jgi:hypothetical protein
LQKNIVGQPSLFLILADKVAYFPADADIQETIDLLHLEFGERPLRNVVMCDDNAQGSVDFKSSDPNTKPSLFGG